MMQQSDSHVHAGVHVLCMFLIDAPDELVDVVAQKRKRRKRRRRSNGNKQRRKYVVKPGGSPTNDLTPGMTIRPEKVMQGGGGGYLS